MNGQWNWLIGRKLSLGEVIDVFGESATVRHARVRGRARSHRTAGWAAPLILRKEAEMACCD